MDKEIADIKERMNIGKAKGFREDEHGTLWFEQRIYVPNDPEIRKLILQEAHDSRYSIHPGKANVVADALSRKSYVNTLTAGGMPQELADDLRDLRLEIVP